MILNSVLWVWEVINGRKEAEGVNRQLQGVDSEWGWGPSATVSNHAEDRLNMPLVWKRLQLHIKNSSHIHTWERSAAAVTSSERGYNNPK